MTQGEIGFTLQNSLQTAFRKRGINRPVVTVVTQVLVDKNDPAFQRPTKPIGPFYSKETAERKRKELGWNIIEDAARGYRRVVASPLPKDIVELEVIKGCLERNIVVVAVGGGGIPVIFEDNELKGVEAVIDKDRASALLAVKLGIEHFIISTEVQEVDINFMKPNQQELRSITIAEAKKYFADGQFGEGSMKPKIEAALEFLNSGGEKVTITNPEHLLAALDSETGTRITK
jgi:carbamate kinase